MPVMGWAEVSEVGRRQVLENLWQEDAEDE